MSKPEKITLFPLKMVLLPGEDIPLHIFESRYKKMVSSCIDTDNPFGIILNASSGMKKIGCTAQIVDVLKEYESGEYDIVVQGVQRFEIMDKKKDDNLWVGNIQLLPPDNISKSVQIVEKMQDMYLKILMMAEVNIDYEQELNKKTSYEFAQMVKLPNHIKQTLIELPTERKRLELLMKVFKRALNLLELRHEKNELNSEELFN
mgnify:CR=1 FL=1